MIDTSRFGPKPNVFVAGDRVRVAHGVFGRLGRVRLVSPGHVLVHYDDGSRQLVDTTRRQLWVLG